MKFICKYSTRGNKGSYKGNNRAIWGTVRHNGAQIKVDIWKNSRFVFVGNFLAANITFYSGLECVFFSVMHQNLTSDTGCIIGHHFYCSNLFLNFRIIHAHYKQTHFTFISLIVGRILWDEGLSFPMVFFSKI